MNVGRPILSQSADHSNLIRAKLVALNGCSMIEAKLAAVQRSSIVEAKLAALKHSDVILSKVGNIGNSTVSSAILTLLLEAKAVVSGYAAKLERLRAIDKQVSSSLRESQQEVHNLRTLRTQILDHIEGVRQCPQFSSLRRSDLVAMHIDIGDRLRELVHQVSVLESARRLTKRLIGLVLHYLTRLVPSPRVFLKQLSWFLYHANVAPPTSSEKVAVRFAY